MADRLGRSTPILNSLSVLRVSDGREFPRIALELPGAFSAFCPSKRILLGAKVFPFSGLDYIGDFVLNEVRWSRRLSTTDVFGPVHLIDAASVGDFTDVLAAARFMSHVIDQFGSHIYKLTLVNEFNELTTTHTTVVCEIVRGSDKNVQRRLTFRPFADFMLAADPTQIEKIEYEVL